MWRTLAILLCFLALGCGSDQTTPPQTERSAAAGPLGKPAADAQAVEPQPDSFVVEDGFRKLTLADFEPFFAKPPKAGTPATWTESGTEIVCTGKPKGYLVSKDSFGDFTLRLDLRFVPTAEQAKDAEFNPNTGVLLFIQPPNKQWPKSFEVQGRFAELGTIKPNGGAADVELKDDMAARETARQPAGEWNSLEIESKAGSLTVRLNGTVVCSSQPGELTSGTIGLQAEEFEVRFRRLRIRTDSGE